MVSQDIMNEDDTSSSFSSHSSEFSSSSLSSISIVITKTKSNKRKSMLVINGYNFQFKNFNNKGTIKFWRCANRSCGVLLHTSLNEEFLRYSGKVTEHTHLPNPAEEEIRNLRETMRQRAENELSSLQEIAEQEMRKALLTAEALAVLPSASTIGMILIF